MNRILTALILSAAVALPAAAQHPRQGGNRQQEMQEMQAKMKAEAEAYYANADTAEYGVRYRFKYKYNKEDNLTYDEDRVVLIRPEVTLDMSYEGIGETRWRQAHPNEQGGDMSLAYHLTPSFYFYYPENDREVKFYRVIAEDFKLDDRTSGNKWKITDEQKKIGTYNCRKATLDKDGRKWTAWFTTELPYKAGPRTLTGLPGVVLEASDADGEVRWLFNGLVDNQPESKLYIRVPDKFSTVPAKKFKKILDIFGRTSSSQLHDSGVWEVRPGHYPEKYRPSTGIDGINVDNPIER